MGLKKSGTDGIIRRIDYSTSTPNDFMESDAFDSREVVAVIAKKRVAIADSGTANVDSYANLLDFEGSNF